MDFHEVFKLVGNLMQEAGVDLNKDVERYAKSTEFAPNENEFDEYLDDPDLQWDTEEALAEALLVFFGGLSESSQAEIRDAARRFAVAPTEKNLEKWKGISWSKNHYWTGLLFQSSQPTQTPV